ncbi:MAG: chromosome segregation protein SMC [Gammaproteobacteria bacterium]
MKPGLTVLLRFMRLRKIKLSGFKSFVDPTTLVIPGNLAGVVGPNGCGKSNIIDAVTWVMGESSAKHLRGDSLTDVIFNGSNTRQPVGQASVELIFDNSDGRAGGQYAAYSEISIKRQINREGVSTYMLNGARCRRKDIQSLFLGTGLGPRSYSIIEQGMISRLIEAKPDELRVYIEEAAGISKYRERRRETENRIRHTRENLDRLNDIREELERQLNHLQRQARAAERYQVLKKEERQAHAELLALNWRDLKAEIQQREEKVREHENRLEQGVAELRKTESDIERLRDELTGANETFNQVQSDYYQVGGDISQLEQKIQHTRERISALETDLQETRESIRAGEQQQTQDQEQLQRLREKTASLEPRLQGSRSESNQAYDSLNEAEQAMQGWQAEWEAFQENISGYERQIDVDNTRLSHLEASLEEIRYRRQVLNEELDSQEQEELERQLAELEGQLQRQQSELQGQRNEREEQLDSVRANRDRVHQLNEQLAELRSEQQKLAGRIASLESLQQDALGEDGTAISEWLASLGLDNAARLVEEISVEDQWAHALETVLDRHLQSFYIEDITAALEKLGELEHGHLSILSGQSTSPAPAPGKSYPRLLDKVAGAPPLADLLRDVYIADTMGDALAVYRNLSDGESVVTPDGVWLGPNRIRINRPEQEEDGILAREQTIKALKEEEARLTAEVERCRAQLDAARQALENAEESQHSLEGELNNRQETLSEARSRQSSLNTRLEQVIRRKEQVQEELEELDEREQSEQEELETIRSRVARIESDKEALSSERSHLADKREQHRRLLDEARSRWQETHEQSHEIALQLESLSSQRASLEQTIKRNEHHINHLNGRYRELQENLEKVTAPLQELQDNLESRLAQRMETEGRLNQVREEVRAIDAKVRQREQDRTTAEQAVTEYRNELEKVRYGAQEIRIRLQTVEEQLQADEHSAEALLQELDEDAQQDAWKEKIESLERKIQRLGPINLAAIDEYNQLTERKTYLDSQHEDLNNALTTLENAIRKIDKETRTRFKETFDLLNTNLKETFPVLFGGGHAYLEMTGEDLLETGVALMAQPPGKKNSTIHLLSGGEKALTAIALVFSIFKLNPAPFCILDEVDAPLDDTNTERFSRLLAEMANDVQFLFITHNKITMEIAQQLLGVTMQEAGVSRLVSVDMEEAVKMAASA